MPWETIITAIVSVVGTGFGLKVLPFLLSKWKGEQAAEEKKDTQLFQQYKDLHNQTIETINLLQVRINTLEAENRQSHQHEIDCWKENAVLKARVSLLETKEKP